MHLDDGLPYQGCSKEGPERNQKMTTSYSSQVKEGIWNLNKYSFDLDKAFLNTKNLLFNKTSGEIKCKHKS